MAPFFSIIIPLYNKEKHVENTLKSVLAQSFQDFEIIIVNDGSTDGSLSEVSKIKDERIKIFSIENQGVSHARNYGIERSNADFIAFLDADDNWYPNHLEDLKNLIAKFPDCGVYATGYESVFNGHNTFKAKFKDIDDDFIGIVNDYFHHSLMNQIAWTSAVVIPKKILSIYGRFDVSLRAGEDTDLWTRIALHEKVAFDAKISAQKVLSQSRNHLSKSIHTLDKMNFLNKFKDNELENESFKMYMDYNRYSIAIERKMASDVENLKLVKQQINLNNLNNKQRILLQMPSAILISLKRLQNFLQKHNIYLSAFR